MQGVSDGEDRCRRSRSIRSQALAAAGWLWVCRQSCGGAAGGSEFSQAIATYPIGFIEGSPGSYMPVAVMALSKGGNLFVGPGGQWLGGYIPVLLRRTRFR